jgi:hypothetical protein
VYYGSVFEAKKEIPAKLLAYVGAKNRVPTNHTCRIAKLLRASDTQCAV